MADRYWVGGTGSWSSTNTANWSDTSGGSGGFSVPTASDNVFFDAGSDSGGTFVVTMANSPRVCNDITISGLDFGMTLAGASIALTVSGSLSFPATLFTRTYTGTTTFNATTSGKTITTNGVAFGGTVTLDGVGGEWTLGSAFSTGASALLLTKGTFDTGGYNVTANGFSSNNSNTRTINLNASTLTFSSTSPWDITTSTNATLNAGTSEIICSSTLPTFNGGGLTYYNLSFTGTGGSSRTINQSNTFNNLSITPNNSGLIIVSLNGSQTINGTLTATGASYSRRIFLRSSIAGTARTLTCAAIAATSDTDFRDITIAGAHGTLSGTRLGDCDGNTNITFDAPKTVYWNLAGGGDWSSDAWALSSGGAVSTANFPLAQDSVIIEDTGLNTSATITIDSQYNIGPLDMSTRSNAMTLATSANFPTFYGNVTYSSAVTPTGTNNLTFSNRSIKTFDCAGKTFDTPMVIDAPGGGIQLINNSFVTGATRLTTLTRGTLDLNDLDWTTGTFNTAGSNTREIDFGTGEINVTGTGTAWFTSVVTNLTVSGTPVVNVTSTGATAITVTSGPLTEANSISFNFTGGTYALTFLGSSSNAAKNVDFTGFAGTWNAINTTTKVFGNLTLSTGMTLTATSNPLTFAGTSGTQLITSNGKTMDFPITFDGVGGTFQLQDAMTLGSTRQVSFTNGTVDLNGYTLTSGTGRTNTGTKNITFNGGTLLLSGSGSNAWIGGSANFTTTAGTGTGAISMTSASAKTFGGGGATYNCNLNQGGAGDLTITGSNTFNDIKNSVQPATILFTAGTTQTVSDFTLSGTSGNLITIDSTTASQFTLSKASGTVSVSFVEVRDSIGTGGATWNAFTSNGNVDGGNNTGWIFSAVTSTGNMFMMFH